MISGCSVCRRCIDFTPLNVSGRMNIRTVKVSRMIDQPQEFGPSPITPCQNSSTHSQASIRGWRTF